MKQFDFSLKGNPRLHFPCTDYLINLIPEKEISFQNLSA